MTHPFSTLSYEQLSRIRQDYLDEIRKYERHIIEFGKIANSTRVWVPRAKKEQAARWVALYNNQMRIALTDLSRVNDEIMRRRSGGGFRYRDSRGRFI